MGTPTAAPAPQGRGVDELPTPQKLEVSFEGLRVEGQEEAASPRSPRSPVAPPPDRSVSSSGASSAGGFSSSDAGDQQLGDGAAAPPPPAASAADVAAALGDLDAAPRQWVQAAHDREEPILTPSSERFCLLPVKCVRSPLPYRTAWGVDSGAACRGGKL